MGSSYLMGRASVWEDEKLLEADGGDGCITTGMYLCHWAVHLKMFKMVNFI